MGAESAAHSASADGARCLARTLVTRERDDRSGRTALRFSALRSWRQSRATHAGRIAYAAVAEAFGLGHRPVEAILADGG